MICSKCGKNKDLDHFHFRKESGKYRKQCRDCFNQKCSEYRKKNSETIKARNYKYSRTVDGRFASFKALAKTKGIEQKLTKEDFEELQTNQCNYCGDNFDRGTGYGIDRVDSNIGYYKENSVACCSKCNFAKHELEYNEFVQHILKMAKHIGLNHKY
jgi:hypothetical protein